MSREKEQDILRAKLRHLWAVYEGIYVLINASTCDMRLGFEQSRKNIETLTIAQLRNAMTELSDRVQELKSLYGVAVDDKAIVWLAKVVENSGSSGLALIPKYMLDQFFKNYEAALLGFTKLPHHVRIGIDPGLYRTKQGTAELYLVEAALFEDICSLNNLVLNSEKKKKTKPERKRHDALVRSMIDGFLGSWRRS